MSDRYEAMQLFVQVTEAGSLSAAARAQRLPLATVSRRIADLERRLGAPLFARASRRLALTEGGRRYLDGCRRVLADVQDLEAAILGEHGAPSGEISITAPIVFGRTHVLPLLTEFLHLFPSVRAKLLLVDRTVNIVDEGIDLAVRFGELPSSSLMARPFGRVRRVVCASPTYWAARGVAAEPKDLLEHDIVAFAGLAGDVWRFATASGEVAVDLTPRLAVNTAEAAIDAAEAGLGVSRLLSYQVAGAVEAGRLVPALTAFEGPALPGHLVHAGGRFVPARLRALIDFVAPRLRKQLGRD